MADNAAYELFVQMQLATEQAAEALKSISDQMSQAVEVISKPIEIKADARAFNEVIIDTKGVAGDAFDTIAQKSKAFFVGFGRKAREVAAVNAALDNYADVSKNIKGVTEKTIKAETQYELVQLRKKRTLRELSREMREGGALTTKGIRLQKEVIEQNKEMAKGQRLINALKDAEKELAASPKKMGIFGSLKKGIGGGIDLAIKVAVRALQPLIKVLSLLGDTLKSILSPFIAWQDLLKMQERYAAITFRAAGSIDALVASTNRLRRDLGLTVDQASASIEALAVAGVRTTQVVDGTVVSLDEFAKINAQVSIATGVSADIVARLQKQMASANIDIGRASEVLANMENAARMAGLSMQELGGIMDRISQMSLTLTARYGADVAAQFAEHYTAIAAFAKEAGDIGVNEVENLLDSITQAPQQFAMVLREAVVVDDPIKRLRALTNNFQDFMKIYQTIPDVAKKDFAAQNGFTENQIGLLEKMTTKINELGGNYDQFIDQMLTRNEEVGRSAEEDIVANFDSAMNTLQRSFQRLVTPFMTILSDIFNQIAPFVQELMQELQPIVQSFMSEWDDILPVIKDALKDVFNVLKGLKEPLKALMEVGTALFRIAVAFGVEFLRGMGQAGKGADGLTTTFGSLAETIQDMVPRIMEFGRRALPIAQKLGELFMKVVDILMKSFTPIMGIVTGMFDVLADIGPPVLLAMAEVMEFMIGLMASIVNSIKEAWQGLKNVGRDVRRWFTEDDRSSLQNYVVGQQEATSQTDRMAASLRDLLSGTDDNADRMAQLGEAAGNLGNNVGNVTGAAREAESAINGLASAQDQLNQNASQLATTLTEATLTDVANQLAAVNPLVGGASPAGAVAPNTDLTTRMDVLQQQPGPVMRIPQLDAVNEKLDTLDRSVNQGSRDSVGQLRSLNEHADSENGSTFRDTDKTTWRH